ncbi:uncharacterized protein ACR2FA_002141 [Aphomia sociella]
MKQSNRRLTEIMYRVLVLVSFALAVTLADDAEELKKCSRIIMHPAVKHCCKERFHPYGHRPPGHHKRPAPNDVNLKECFQPSKKMDPCERETCIANKKGFASADGVIDKDALGVIILKEFDDKPVLKDNIISNCVVDDLSKFGPEDMCDVMKLRQCFELQFLKECVEWDEEAPCEGTKKLVEDCTALLS